MIRTRVGYAGGTTKAPAYDRLGDHTETIQIDYDPREITYNALLDIFWQSHNPATRPWSEQYKTAIYYHNDEQKEQAIQSRDRMAVKLGGKIYTEIIPLSEFHQAETYHQKYRLQQHPDLLQEFQAMYPVAKDFIDSTAAARVNGYLSGYGSVEQLETELSGLGLSARGSEKLKQTVGAFKPK